MFKPLAGFLPIPIIYLKRYTYIKAKENKSKPNYQ